MIQSGTFLITMGGSRLACLVVCVLCASMCSATVATSARVSSLGGEGMEALLGDQQAVRQLPPEQIQQIIQTLMQVPVLLGPCTAVLYCVQSLQSLNPALNDRR